MTVELLVTDVLELRTMEGYKVREQGEKKPFIEGKQGSELFRQTGEWHSVTRRIDRRSNQYDEVIVDEGTGKVVREVHEPLTEHIGRGSAKPHIPPS